MWLPGGVGLGGVRDGRESGAGDGNHDVYDGRATRPYRVAQGAIVNILR